jgi:hypothetical protein
MRSTQAAPSTAKPENITRGVKPIVSSATELRIRAAVTHSIALGFACVAAYEFTTEVLSRVHSISPSDDLLGGMWAVVATVVVYRTSYQESAAAAWTRSIATLLGFALSLAYLVVAPFHPWALGALIGISTLIMLLLRRPDAAVTAGVTVAVVMIVAAISPKQALEEPVLRLVDTAIGVAFGIVVARAAKSIDGSRQAQPIHDRPGLRAM